MTDGPSWEEWSSWPLERRRSTTSAWYGLMEGDLEPLKRHIRDGWPIDPDLAESIAGAIEANRDAPFRLVLQPIKGRGSFDQMGERAWREEAIGPFVEKRFAEVGAGGFASAVSEAEDVFGVSRTTVINLYRTYVWGQIKR